MKVLAVLLIAAGAVSAISVPVRESTLAVRQDVAAEVLSPEEEAAEAAASELVEEDKDDNGDDNNDNDTDDNNDNDKNDDNDFDFDNDKNDDFDFDDFDDFNKFGGGLDLGDLLDDDKFKDLNFNLVGGIDNLLGGLGLNGLFNDNDLFNLGGNELLELFVALQLMAELRGFGVITSNEILALIQGGIFGNLGFGDFGLKGIPFNAAFGGGGFFK